MKGRKEVKFGGMSFDAGNFGPMGA